RSRPAARGSPAPGPLRSRPRAAATWYWHVRSSRDPPPPRRSRVDGEQLRTVRQLATLLDVEVRSGLDHLLQLEALVQVRDSGEGVGFGPGDSRRELLRMLDLHQSSPGRSWFSKAPSGSKMPISGPSCDSDLPSRVRIR